MMVKAFLLILLTVVCTTSAYYGLADIIRDQAMMINPGIFSQLDDARAINMYMKICDTHGKKVSESKIIEKNTCLLSVFYLE